ncbi:MAG: hypothetical protein ACRDYX_21690 [Egibacteraceae bacterium]
MAVLYDSLSVSCDEEVEAELWTSAILPHEVAMSLQRDDRELAAAPAGKAPASTQSSFEIAAERRGTLPN